MDLSTEVAIVGGGPAGAALGIGLAERGVEVTIFERWPEPRWRASGVYSSPLTRQRLLDLGLGRDRVDALIRPIRAMEVVSIRGPRCELGYDHPYACGLDRVRLERALLDRASQAGAQVLEGSMVRQLRRSGAGTQLLVASRDGTTSWQARLVAGADGPASIVARAYGASRPVRMLRQAGMTVHRRDTGAPVTGAPVTATITVGPGWYCGVAPVPGGRVNIGIVMGEGRLRAGLAGGSRPAALVARIVDSLPPDSAAWRGEMDCDAVQVALPLAHRVARRSGPGFLLVGDAAGFVDPLSGEGVHRALVSAELAADAIEAWRRGRHGSLARYDKAMAGRFEPKDLLSWVLQAFVRRPFLLDHALRRLATRDAHRHAFGSALADLRPARDVLQPSFLVGLLRP